MGEPFRTRRLVEFADTDMAGIAHFSAFFRWMEAAEHELLRSIGLGVHTEIGDERISFPRVNAECDYRSPARFEDSLDIAVTVTRLGGKSVTYAFRFTLDGATVAEGVMTSVCCRLAEGAPPEPIELPAAFRDRLRSFVAA